MFKYLNQFYPIKYELICINLQNKNSEIKMT